MSMRTWCARSALRNTPTCGRLARRFPRSTSRRQTNSPSASRTANCAHPDQQGRSTARESRGAQRPTPRGRSDANESAPPHRRRQPRTGCSTSALALAVARAGRERRPRGAPVQPTDRSCSGRDLWCAVGTWCRARPRDWWRLRGVGRRPQPSGYALTHVRAGISMASPRRTSARERSANASFARGPL